MLALFIIGNMPSTSPATEPVDDKASDLVWLTVPGPGRRGVDAGDGKPEPPRKAERPRRHTITHPVATPPKLAHEPLKDVPKPHTEINIPAVDTSADVVDLPGALTGLPTVPSQGSAVGEGTGSAPERADRASEPAPTVESATTHSVLAAASQCRAY